MNMLSSETIFLRALLASAQPVQDAGLRTPGRSMTYRDLLNSTGFGDGRRDLAGRSVLIDTISQLDSALAMLALDGLAARIVIAPSDFSEDQIASAATQATCGAVIGDRSVAAIAAGTGMQPSSATEFAPSEAPPPHATEWVLPTSGTTGAPKLVAHDLRGLLGGAQTRTAGETPVWATFYDIRRYGGLQIFLRAVTTGTTLVVSDANESLGDHIARMAEAGVTHITGTPSHWRRLLMSSEAGRLSPHYVRLSGEIADQAVLDSLRAAYPKARIVHAYASTEAGVGFEVDDELEGFPAAYFRSLPHVDMQVVDGSLRIRSARTAKRYVGSDDRPLADAHGFVDTDDMIELRGDRYHFLGRRAGVINIGGLKVHPEEIEQIINAHDGVRVSLVRGRRSPITGQIIEADVVLKTEASPLEAHALRQEVLDFCRARLDRHKVPTTINFVPSLDLLASGKLKRRHA